MRHTNQLQQLVGTTLSLATLRSTDKHRKHNILTCRELLEKMVELKDKAYPLIAKLRQLTLAHTLGRHPIERNTTRIGLHKRTYNLK